MTALRPASPMRRSQDVALAALSRLDNAIIVISSNGRIAYANLAADRLGLVSFEGERSETSQKTGNNASKTTSLIGENIANLSANAYGIFSNAPLRLTDVVEHHLKSGVSDSRTSSAAARSYALVVDIKGGGHAHFDHFDQLKLEIQTWSEADEMFVTLTIRNPNLPDNPTSPPPLLKQDSSAEPLESPAVLPSLPTRPSLPERAHSGILKAGTTVSYSEASSVAQLAREFSGFAEAIYHSRATKAGGFILSADERFCFPNYLGTPNVEPVEIDDIETFFKEIPCWTADFGRKLHVSEYPSLVLNRTRKDFCNRYGIEDAKGERIVIETEAECLWSGFNSRGEARYIGGVTWNKNLGTYEELRDREMKERLASFETICESMPHLVWTSDPTGFVDFASKSWRNFTGMHGNLADSWGTVIHPEDLPALESKFSDCLKRGVEGTIDVRYRRHDGIYRWSMVKTQPLHSADGDVLKFYGTVTDVHEIITERIEAAQWKTQMLATLAHADINIFCLDLDWRINLAEGGLQWKTSVDGPKQTKIDMLGVNMLEYLHQLQPEGAGNQDVPRWEEGIRNIMEGSTDRFVAEGFVAGRWLRTILGPLLGQRNGESVLQGVLGFTTDQTEANTLVVLERENARLLSEEKAARENDRMKSMFLANVSHEIRTPIAGVTGMCELLFQTHLNSDQQELANDIRASAQNLLTIVNDLLDFAKIEAGSFQVEAIPFKPSEVTDAVVRGFRRTAQERNLKIRYESELSPSMVMLGDSVRIMQVLNNLFTNAIKFTSAGSVSMSVKIKAIEGVRSLEFVVEDTGIGIDDLTMKKLFQPFGQGDSSTARRFGGTGLGLVISRNLSQLMGGSLHLESVPNIGTKAIFVIPIRGEPGRPAGQNDLIAPVTFVLPGSNMVLNPRPRPVPTQSAPNTRTNSTAPPHGSVKGHVLVVEDNAINQKIAVKTVRHLGYAASAVWNGQEALDYLLDDATGPFVDIVLMDCQMPVMDGYTATTRIRKDERFAAKPHLRNLPVIALTASAIKGDQEKCEKAGMSGYLAKPFNAAALEQLLSKWMAAPVVPGAEIVASPE